MKFLRRLLFAIGLLLPLSADAANNPSAFVPPPGSYSSTQGSVINIFTPQMFGAKCDDSTDDTVAIQAAETAAGLSKNQAAVVFIGPNLCKTTSPITLSVGVDHYCYLGMNFGDSGSGISNRCGVIGLVGSGNYVFILHNANGAVGVQSPTFHDMYITSTGGGIQLNTPSGGFSNDGTTQAPMMFPRVDRVTISTNGISWQCSKCFWGGASGGEWNGAGASTLDLEGSDLIEINNVSFSGSTNENILIQAHNTFGNSDSIVHSQIGCPIVSTAIDCIHDNGRSTVVTDNFIECLGSFIMNQAVHIGDTSSPETLQFFYKDNVIDCAPSQATHGLVVDQPAGIYLGEWENNSSSGVSYGSAVFNSGGGLKLWINPSAQSQIFHQGNSNEGGFPFSSFNNFPETGSHSSKTLAYIAPGGTSYNINGNALYGASVVVNNGAYQLPAATGGGNGLNFNVLPYNYTGTIDICAEVFTTTASQQFNLIPQDGGSTVTTSTFTATSAPAWYCYTGHNFTTGVSAEVTNNDTTHNGSVQVLAVTFTQE